MNGADPASHRGASAASVPQRVLFLVNDLRFGGAEKHVVELVNTLDPALFEVHLIRLGLEADLLNQVNPSRLAGNVALSRTSRFSLDAVREIAAYIDEHRVTTVVCVNEYPMIYAYAARLRAAAKPRLVEIFHTTDLLDRVAELKMRLVYRWIFARFDAVVFVSRRQRDVWLDDRGLRTRRTVTIHNGIDAAAFSGSTDPSEAEGIRADIGAGQSGYLVGVCAALRPEKRHVDVVSAVALLVDQGLPIRLLIIGEGPQRKEIEAWSERVGIADRVRITGFQADVRPFINACDAMVMASSKVETFSIAVLEAMALGKPVVSSDVGGAREQIDHGVTGYLFDHGDVRQLSESLKDLTDSGRRAEMGLAARRKVEAEFTAATMVGRYEDLLQSLRS